MAADILELFRQCITDEHLVARMRERASRQRLKRRDVITLDSLPTQLSAVQPGFVITRVERQRAIVGEFRLIDSTNEAQ